MKLLCVGRVVVGLIFFSDIAASQVASFPYFEHFDSIAPPALPTGWTTTANRLPAGDFVSSSSSPHSVPLCLYSQNSAVSQSLISSAFDFSHRTPDKLQFYIARSSTHTSGLLVEASTDDGVTFSIALSDTMKNPGTSSYVPTTLQLPASLANLDRVRIRWRIVGGTGGISGTIRIDDVTVSTIVSYDLAPTRLSVHPTLAISTDSLILIAVVKNFGIQAATNYTLGFFCDLNNNFRAEPSEQFASIAGQPIQPSDSAIIIAGHSRLKPGDYRFITVVSLALDEKSSNDTASCSIAIGYPKGILLVNEFMYAPSGDEPEWVELLNCSQDTVNLRNWKLSDNNVSTKTVITTGNLFIAPTEYCIVAKDANFTTIHPSVSCPVTIAGFAAFNNTTPDDVIIYDSRSVSMDSVYYVPGWGGQGGKSMERVDTDQNSLDPLNWATSHDSLGSTPGKANSIVRLLYDLAAGRLFETKTESETGLNPVINFTVLNNGKHSVTTYAVNLYLDSNHNTVGEPNELIVALTSTAALGPRDSAQYSFVWQSVPQGESSVIAVIEYPQDQRPGNNRTSMIIRTSYSIRSVIVNEIMFDPLANQNEWIELYNRGGSAVDLKNWKFRDRPTPSGNMNTFTIARQPVFLHPGEFMVVAADSTIFSLYPDLMNPPAGCRVVVLNESGGFSLGNDGDDIILEDLLGLTIDSVSYSARWHRPDVTDTKGRALEKINPDLDSNSPYNWTTSVAAAGGTPGKVNSTRTVALTTSATLAFSPNPFSPDGDGFEDFCLVQYNLPFATALIHVKIFDVKGRLVRTLANSQISSSHGEILWDGTDQNRRRVRIGPYIVLLQATDPNGKASTALKGVVVVAAKL